MVLGTGEWERVGLESASDRAGAGDGQLVARSLGLCERGKQCRPHPAQPLGLSLTKSKGHTFCSPRKIESITLREVQMSLKAPFEASFGVSYHRRIILAEVVADGVSGWGEVDSQGLQLSFCVTPPRFQRSSWGRPVRADSRAASRISITCTFNLAESGSSIGLL
jgi:hypothetical protein